MTTDAGAEVQQQIRLRAARQGTPLLRNNSGATLDDKGRMIRFGLGNDSAKINKVFKSPDLVGIFPVVIMPEHVGRTFGLFFGVECKPPGWQFRESDSRAVAQKNFGEWVQRHGGMWTFATSVKDVWG